MHTVFVILLFSVIGSMKVSKVFARFLQGLQCTVPLFYTSGGHGKESSV